MEEICSSISALLSKDGKSGYKIYYEEELLDALPENVRNRETLEAALKNLQSGGFLDVKYARGNAFCIANLKQFSAAESAQDETEETETPVPAPAAPSKKMYVAVALSSFLGGALGGCIAAVLGAVL